MVLASVFRPLVVPSQPEDRAGVIGAAIMMIERVLSPDAIDRGIRRGVAA